MSYGHYDPIARKDRCSKCCGDREIEKTSWADCVYKTSPSHHRNHRKCAEHWNLFIRNSNMIRCGGKVLVVLTLLCLLGLIFEGSSSSIVSESEKIHLGEEANIVMVRILLFHQGTAKLKYQMKTVLAVSSRYIEKKTRIYLKFIQVVFCEAFKMFVNVTKLGTIRVMKDIWLSNEFFVFSIS